MVGLAADCWQVLEATVFAVHRAAGHTVLMPCWHTQKKKNASAVVSTEQNGLMKNWHCFIVPSMA